ncbi:phospholipase D family protein [Vibrio penaeicida]|uniref:Phospholipase D family protein n=1 Tax=Vibrio penaeicida TaxID=104609 RepID=A0AAV5NRB9_9VIBR|nr:phospholipase D family protein [Vibrio penaeicida]RTZ23623.1 phospholipase D family protein [Vibrio penaeicida]GLQ73023.1 phospholipase D family protein [Vibrio penaeicida]
MSIFRNITFALLSAPLLGCSPAPDSVPVSEKNHCRSLAEKTPLPISHFIEPYRAQMETKTGVYVLEQGTEAMMSRAWLTERAEKTIDVQYFIFSVDNVGLIATDYLVRAAERGVKVRVLVDDIMLDARGDELLILAAHENFEIKIYNPNANIGKNIAQKISTAVTDFHGINQRMHNKVFLVDSQIAITGGRNIADEYFGFDHEYNFRDRDVFLAGQAVKHIDVSFEEYWNNKLSVPVEDLFSTPSHDANPDFSRLHSYACNPEHFHPQIRSDIEKVPTTFQRLAKEGKFKFVDNVEYISDQPGKNDRHSFLGGGSVTQDRLVQLAESAQKSILIQTPYLVTTKKDRAFLRELVDKGITIKILTNSLASNDNLAAFSGYQRNRKQLLDTGVEIYEFKPDAKIRQRVMTEHMYKKLSSTPIFGLHAKTMVVDESITAIGTYNFDPRSANLNTESFAIIHSPEITQHVSKSMHVEMEPENAWRITPDFNPDSEVSISKQIGVKLRRFIPKDVL